MKIKGFYFNKISRVLLLAVLLFCPGLYGQGGGGDNSIVQADNLFKQGRNLFDQGHFTKALTHWRSAADRYASLDKKNALVEALYGLARGHQALGQYGRALQTLDRALDYIPELDNARMHAKIVGAIGQMHTQLGDLNTARQYLEIGLEIAATQSQPEIWPDLYLSLGNLAIAANKSDAALKYYRQCWEAADRCNQPVLAAKARINAARVYLKQNHSNQASFLLKKALQVIANEPDSHDKAYALIAIGRLSTRLHAMNPEDNGKKHLRRAYLTLKAASATAASIQDPRASSYAWGYMGALYETQGRFRDALQLTHRAIDVLQSIQAPEILFRWQWQAARLLKATHNPTRAIEAYHRAVEGLEKLRHALAPTCHARGCGSFRQIAQPIYLELADLLLTHGATIDDQTRKQKMFLAARTVMDQLKLAELQDYFQDDCVMALKTKETPVETILEHTAVIYPILFPDRLELLVSYPNFLKRYTSTVSANELNEIVNLLRFRLQEPTNRLYRQPARELYEWLVRPLDRDLHENEIETLVFAPNGPLRTIPLATLYDQKQKQFLIEQYALAVTPGLTLIAPQRLPRENARILVAGINQAVGAFQPLPHVAHELKAIQGLYDATLLVNKDFTIDNMARAYQKTPFTMIHIASHARFYSDPEQTFLLAFDGKLTPNRLQNMIEQGRFREKAVELLTLSACETAAGDERAALGLAGVGVKAGARAVLASLWLVNDQSTAQLTTAFYQRLRDSSLSRAQALQKAQLQLLQTGRFRHPAYWAAFVLIGNWL